MENFADSLNNLPMDDEKLNPEENGVFNTLYKDDEKPKPKKQQDIMSLIFNSGIKETIIAGLLFTIISMPFVNKIIEKSMGERKTVIKLGVKTVVFMVLFYIIKSFVINEKK